MSRRTAAAALLCALAGTPAHAGPGWLDMPAPLLPVRLPVADGPGWALSASASAFEASDAVPVRDISGTWSRYAPRQGGNAGLLTARAEVAAAHRGWELAWVARGDWLVTGPRSSWDAVHAYKSRQTPAEGSHFEVRAHEHGVVFDGLRGARSWQLPAGLRLSAAATVLSVRRLEQVDALGGIGYTAAGGYAFQVDAARRDSTRQYGGYGLSDTRGNGWSTDLGLLWQPDADRFVNLSIVDLASRLHVNSVATQRAVLSSSTRSTDAAGYLDYKPLVNGRYASERVTGSLDRKASLVAGTAWDVLGRRLQVGGRYERVGDVGLPALWAAVPVVGGLSGQVDLDLRFHSLGLGLAGRYGSVMLRSSATRFGEAKALGAQAALRLPL